MRPPYCAVCGLSLRDVDDEVPLRSAFTLVHFQLDADERAAAEARDRAGWVGHPENAEWFCKQHEAVGRSRQHLHWREALAQIAELRGQG